MDEKELILKILTKNYRVKLDLESFSIYDLNNQNKLLLPSFMTEIKTLIGNYLLVNGDYIVKSLDIVNDWVIEEKRKLTSDIFEYVDTLDLSIGSQELMIRTLEKFKHNSNYESNFLISIINDFYSEKILKPKLMNHIALLESLTIDEITSNTIVNRFEDQLHAENHKQREYATEILMDWYKNSVIDEKINEFFSELVVTLGQRSWVVTWIGHGQLTLPKIIDHFGRESRTIVDYVTGRYNKWYDNAIIEASERIISKNKFMV